MTGNYLLDTNIVIYAINHQLNLPSGRYSVSIITEMELLSFPGLGAAESAKLEKLLSNFRVITIDERIKVLTIQLRRNTSLKLPDAIISATASEYGCTLVTNDRRLSGAHREAVFSMDELIDKS